MSDKRLYILRLAPHPSRKLAAAQCELLPDGTHVIFDTDPSRTLAQNAYQWPYLEGFSKQLKWPVNGELAYLSRDEWKDILTAGFEKEVNPRVAMGIDGGMVMLGRRTSNFGKKKFSEWMEYLMAISAIKGIEPIFKNGSRKWGEEMAGSFVGE